MAETLCSIGLDVGTTSTQLIVSELTIENRASAFAVPELEIAERKILYRGEVHFTPLLDESLVDATRLRSLVEEEYRRAGIKRYGKVAETRVVKRSDIPVPMSRDNPDEAYYLFTVESWEYLDRPISLPISSIRVTSSARGTLQMDTSTAIIMVK